MPNLQLRGLMAMAPRGEKPEDARPTFARVRGDYLRTSVKAKIGGTLDGTFLSMGMSDDFEVAVEEGSNHVRIGRALFGESSTGPSA